MKKAFGKISSLTRTETRCLELFIDTLTKKLGKSFKKAVLFGSRARGEGDEESDIDVLVLLDKVTIDKKHLVWDLANDISLDSDIYISPLVMSSEQFQKLRDHERLIALEIEKDGVPLL